MTSGAVAGICAGAPTHPPGYYADFAVLSDDFFEIPEGRIPGIEALLTVVGGRVVHAAGFLVDVKSDLPRFVIARSRY
ncbi:amidohydrolase family protein [Streptomyces canus]|uniref:amidohydrolase family protein n=1 Tax=Streptomyces canus TaxID=58343 RepID=UPI003682D68B